MVKNTESLGQKFNLLNDSVPGRAPSPPCETDWCRFHPHDRRGLEVLRPDFASIFAHGEEVLGVERVPLHSHHLAAVALEKENKSDTESKLHLAYMGMKNETLCQATSESMRMRTNVK